MSKKRFRCILASKFAPWTTQLFNALVAQNDDIDWVLCETPEQLQAALSGAPPDWIFFFHWSKIVQKDVYGKHRCVVLHTSNLPYGRGGSPIQNQIVDGTIESRVNAIKMVGKLDAGDIYCSKSVTLIGGLLDIWMRIADVSVDLIRHCVLSNHAPQPQPTPASKVEPFKRLQGTELNFLELASLQDLYDRIRMLDAPGMYPLSQVTLGGFTVKFSRAQYDGTQVICDAIIVKNDPEKRDA